MRRGTVETFAVATGFAAVVTNMIMTVTGITWAVTYNLTVSATGTVIPLQFPYLTLGWWAAITMFGAVSRSTGMVPAIIVAGLMFVVGPSLIGALV